MAYCPKCGRHFTRESSVKRHERTFHGNERHPCSQCNAILTRHDNLQKHRIKCRGSPAMQSTRTSQVAMATPEYMSSYSTNSTSSLQNPLQLSSPSTNPLDSDANEADFSFLSPFSIPLDLLPTPGFPDSDTFERNVLGRVEYPSPFELIAPPQFLVDAVEGLQRTFPDARMESDMYLCPVRRRTGDPDLNYRGEIDSIDSQLFKAQFVPTVRCMHCPHERFLVIPYYGIGPVEEHLKSVKHFRQVRLREIAHSVTISEALNVYGSVQAMHLTRQSLASGQLSLSDFNGYYVATCNQPLLNLAVKLGDTSALRHLLDEGLDVTSTDKSLRSALHWACKCGRLDMAELLMRHGASLYDRDNNFRTPFDLALTVPYNQGMHTAILLVNIQAAVQLENSPHITLISPDKSPQDNPATPEKSPPTTLSTLALACQHNNPDVVEAMIANGANVNEGEFNRPLEMAIRWSSWRILEIVLKAGADLRSISDIDRQKLRDVASSGTSNYPDLQEKVNLLKQYGFQL